MRQSQCLAKPQLQEIQMVPLSPSHTNMSRSSASGDAKRRCRAVLQLAVDELEALQHAFHPLPFAPPPNLAANIAPRPPRRRLDPSPRSRSVRRTNRPRRSSSSTFPRFRSRSSARSRRHRRRRARRRPTARRTRRRRRRSRLRARSNPHPTRTPLSDRPHHPTPLRASSTSRRRSAPRISAATPMHPNQHRARFRLFLHRARPRRGARTRRTTPWRLDRPTAPHPRVTDATSRDRARMSVVNRGIYRQTATPRARVGRTSPCLARASPRR